ncbi:PREDICTED: iron-sulfur protein NUBPL isoform X1 [Rhagoletis zephyria]|uniref:iron-sulfur protein NUBPL isoform X1 n=2 Tax=Rhagoletis zephyria TaxID=28612 RepID=UPI00081157A2|nr:PREDICTED: iron-sulfur protein NUBPL isoform X1 [Rhagoletis zephyria]
MGICSKQLIIVYIIVFDTLYLTENAKDAIFPFLQATQLTTKQKELMARGLPKRAPLPGVANIVVVASGKGGVGKSTVAVNLAVSLANKGKRVGLLDADIFGPSVPLMMNIHEEPLIDEQNLMIPPINYGVKCLSMGLLARQSDAIIWRGPLVMSAVQRLLKGAVWAPIDILIVDTPPGTGDVHLSLSQNVPITGVLLVSTPQKAALEVTLRGAEMYRKLGVPIIGLTENMGHAICGNCQTRLEIFKNATEYFTKKIGTKILASIPLDGNITECCDEGVPPVIKYSGTEYAKSYQQLAEYIIRTLEISGPDKQEAK